MPTAIDSELQLNGLIDLFYDDRKKLGVFERQSAEQCPPVYRSLLDHTAHMTVTVEQHHRALVKVEVLSESQSAGIYQRRILLRRLTDNRVVQFGIVRLNLNCLPAALRSQVVSGSVPLGRILIESQILRVVQLCDLWKVCCGSELAEHFSVAEGTVTYGRTARILVDGLSGIELLEIVIPEIH